MGTGSGKGKVKPTSARSPRMSLASVPSDGVDERAEGEEEEEDEELHVIAAPPAAAAAGDKAAAAAALRDIAFHEGDEEGDAEEEEDEGAAGGGAGAAGGRRNTRDLRDKREAQTRRMLTVTSFLPSCSPLPRPYLGRI